MIKRVTFRLLIKFLIQTIEWSIRKSDENVPESIRDNYNKLVDTYNSQFGENYKAKY